MSVKAQQHGYRRRSRQWQLLLKRAEKAKDPDEQEVLLLAVLILARDVVIAIHQEVERSDKHNARTLKCRALFASNRKPWLFLKYARNMYVHATPSGETPMTQHVRFTVNVRDIESPLDADRLLKKGKVLSTRDYVGFAWDHLAGLERPPTAEETDRLEHFLFTCGYELLIAVAASFASELVEASTTDRMS